MYDRSSTGGEIGDATPTYLRSLTETIEAESQKNRPNFMELYRAHAHRLREFAQQGNEVAGWLLRDLLLAQTSPDPEVDDTRDGYTGEKLPICTSRCEDFEGTPDGEYRCKTGIPCLLGEMCPWEDEPHVPQGRMTWRNMPMPGPVGGIAPGIEEERFWMEQAKSTESLLEEDDLFHTYRDHWTQSFDDWDELTEFMESYKPDYDNYYEVVTRECTDVELALEKAEPWQIPALKFRDCVDNVESICDGIVKEFLHGNVSEMTLSVVFYRLCNGVALNFHPRINGEEWEQELGERARELRREYHQWLLMTADHLHLIPDGESGHDWFEEDGEMIEAWVKTLEQQEKRAYQTQVEWEAAMAYRSAACHGSPEDARRAARQIRSDHREKSYLASVDQYIQTCWRPT